MCIPALMDWHLEGICYYSEADSEFAENRERPFFFVCMIFCLLSSWCLISIMVILPYIIISFFNVLIKTFFFFCLYSFISTQWVFCANLAPRLGLWLFVPFWHFTFNIIFHHSFECFESSEHVRCYVCASGAAFSNSCSLASPSV